MAPLILLSALFVSLRLTARVLSLVAARLLYSLKPSQTAQIPLTTDEHR